MGKVAKIVLAIIIVIVGLFGMAYWGSQIVENQKEIDRLENQAQQERMEIQQLEQQLEQLKK